MALQSQFSVRWGKTGPRKVMLFFIKICWQTKLQLCFFIKKTELLSKQSRNLPRAALHVWRPGSKFVYMLGEKLTYFCQPHILPKVLGTVGFKLILKFWFFFFVSSFKLFYDWIIPHFEAPSPSTHLEQNVPCVSSIL